MKIVVPVKRVIDANVKVRLKSDGSAVDSDNMKMSMNPFDEIAVEEAIRLKEAGIASEVVVLSIGSDACQDVLRSALAMGADRALLIQANAVLEPLAVAKVLRAVVEREQPRLVICGKQSTDGDANQVGQMLAGLLGWPQATFASKLELGAESATVTREIDGGLEIVSVTLPAVTTTDLRLNSPRYTTLPNIMKAKKKPLDVVALDDLGVDVRPRLVTLGLSEPAPRSAGVMVADVAELLAKLKNEAKVI
ncbi:electron transfer flavoprotein subunit beta/FixA family protein [Pseudogulbenkiania sp. MAI-1]|uniref:electron transfer flavoprotein subunit beta/FixA family protein n=1 Tax=Pseudogulbenkiania sp. MAI-1 TaxID=990370 RepID=UPI00045E81C4|nr:electron transfer flavoprotein subunit beta/FixA family protein [Pseudogulbenkiania sp. MAI-1]